MKNKDDFFALLDKFIKDGKLPNGMPIGRKRVSEYFNKNGHEFYANNGTEIHNFSKWYMEWYESRNISKENKYNGNSLQNQISAQQQNIKKEIVELSNPEKVEYDRRIRSLIAQKEDYKRKYDHVLNELENAEKRYDVMCAIKEPISFDPIVPNYKPSTGESIAIAQLSDIHIGEKVEPDTVNGFNEYSPDIADKRTYSFFQNLLRIIDSARHDTKVETLFLHLGGDNITGYIHEELLQNNYLSPIEETRFAKRLIIRGIEFLLNHGKFKKIIIQTNWGNHGRTTKKSTHATGYKNNYEFGMYLDVMEYFKSEKKIHFNIQKSNIVYSPLLFDKIIRTGHGDTFNYNGGIGGLAVPLIKYIHRLDSQKKADMNLFCHWHQRIRPINNCLINGSLIGFTAYAQSLGCKPESPVQNLIFLDKKRGFTGEHPIFCD